MSDDRHNNGSHPPGTPGEEARRALAVLARLPRSAGPDSAREKARMAFLRGSDAKAMDDGDSVKDSEPLQAPERNNWGRVAMLLAAVLAFIAIFWYGTAPEQDWVVMNTIHPEGISGEVDLDLTTGARLDAGHLATGPESELTVQLGDKLRFTLLPDTELELPKPPGRWFGRSRRLPLTAGEIFGTSGGQQLGFDLVFHTPELEARLTGTTFAVFRIDVASCVCLWQGGIAVTPLVGGYDVVNLEELNRVWIYKDGRVPEILPLDARETMKLQMTHDMGVAEVPEIISETAE